MFFLLNYGEFTYLFHKQLFVVLTIKRHNQCTFAAAPEEKSISTGHKEKANNDWKISCGNKAQGIQPRISTHLLIKTFRC